MERHALISTKNKLYNSCYTKYSFLLNIGLYLNDIDKNSCTINLRDKKNYQKLFCIDLDLGLKE